MENVMTNSLNNSHINVYMVISSLISFLLCCTRYGLITSFITPDNILSIRDQNKWRGQNLVISTNCVKCYVTNCHVQRAEYKIISKTYYVYGKAFSNDNACYLSHK